MEFAPPLGVVFGAAMRSRKTWNFGWKFFL